MIRTLSKLSLSLAAAALTAGAQSAARVVVWQMKPGQDKAFEDGYKRHLQWHRDNHDTWTWSGWNILTGERNGMFVDATLFHAWTDFDNPVNPGGDGANNAINTDPYGDTPSIGAYAMVPALTSLTPAQLGSPLLTFCYVTVRPGTGAAFEASLRSILPESPHAVLRPVNGVTDYLILLPASKQSDLGTQGAFLAKIIAERVRTELGRYRADMSYSP